jgi:uncharacterized membrane protein
VRGCPPTVHRCAWSSALAAAGFAVSAYLTYLELFVIRAICQWCKANVAAVIAYLVFGTVRLRLAGSDALKTADRR